MSGSSWKKHELRIAKALGGTRSGPVGKEGPDIAGLDDLAVECKMRKSVPAWIRQNTPPDTLCVFSLASGGAPERVVAMRFPVLLAVREHGAGEFPARSNVRAWRAKWLIEMLDQIDGAASGKTPVVVLHMKHRRADTDIAVIRLGHFAARWGGEWMEK